MISAEGLRLFLKESFMDLVTPTPTTFDLFAKTFAEGGTPAALALIAQGMTAQEALASRSSIVSLMPENLPLFQFLIGQGGDANTEDRQGETLLTQAATLGSLEFLKLFISLGADIERENRRHETPLLRAAAAGKAEICETLIACGADVNRGKSRGVWKDVTPLMEAATHNHAEVCSLLLANGAEIERANPAGETALMKAAAAGAAEACAVLLESGADLDARDVEDRPVLHHAMSGMLSVANENKDRKAHERLIQTLIDKGADLSAADRDGDTVATIISRRGDRAAASFLIRLKFRTKAADAGAPVPYNVDRPDAAGITPLVAAIATGDMNELQNLLAQGADVNKPTEKFGATPLVWAVIADDRPVIELLLRHGADVRGESAEGKNALDYAAEKNDASLVDLLLRQDG